MCVVKIDCENAVVTFVLLYYDSEYLLALSAVWSIRSLMVMAMDSAKVDLGSIPVRLSKEGHLVIIAPVPRKSPSFYLNMSEPSSEDCGVHVTGKMSLSDMKRHSCINAVLF